MIGFSQIRSALSTKIETFSGMKLSRFPPDMIGRGPAPLSHLSYSIGFDTISGRGGRQIPSKSVELFSSIIVVFSYRLKPTSIYPSSYDLAMTQEQNIILKILESYSGIQSGMEIEFVSSRREIVESAEYSLHTLNFNITHSINT